MKKSDGKSFKRRSIEWIDERYDVSGLIEFAQKKSVPKFRETIWYYFGGIALLLFIIQALSGILLLMYYQGTEDTAYESVKFISTKVSFGWLVRSVHSWSANLMILAIFIHMFSVFFLKSFRKPRELTWYTGFILLALAMAFGFSGYLLPWNELALFATKVGTDMTRQIPLIGDSVLILLRGGEDVSGATLSRFFGFHVAILPALFTVFLALHLIFIQQQGIAEPEKWEKLPESEKKQIPFFPNFTLRELLIWLIVINILAILAVFFPWELGTKADLFASAPAGIKPEWYFVFMFQVLKLLPANILFLTGEFVGIAAFGIGIFLWFLVPFWDKRTPESRRNKVITYVGIFVVMFMIIFTILGFILE